MGDCDFNWGREARYVGDGRAEFDNPRGWVKGRAEAVFDEAGRFLIRIHIERFEFEGDQQPFGLDGYLGRPRKVDGRWTMGIGGEHNPCFRITITTSMGSFHADEHMLYCRSGYSHFPPQPEDDISIDFHPLRPWFDAVDNSKPVKYWAMPLLNFVSRFSTPWPVGPEHPLRLASGGEGRENALPWGHGLDRIIGFGMAGEIGFIQPLADYESRVENLKTGKDKCVATAVMVGPVLSKWASWEELQSWFPFDLVGLLALKSGIEVGGSWIDLFSDCGRLVRRWHVRMGSPEYFEGAEIIDEVVHGGTGNLLTQALCSPHFTSDHFQVALHNLVQMATNDLTIGDEFNHLARAAEALCNEFRLKKPQQLLQGAIATTVRGLLSETENQILALVPPNARSEPNKRLAESLKRVARAVSGAMETGSSFGEIVVILMAHFGLHDGVVLTAHAQSAGGFARIEEWARVLSKVRNSLAHGGYIDFESVQIRDVFRWKQHLWDILLRCTLKTLDYQGTYHTPLSIWKTSVGLDWVQPSLPIGSLGYGSVADRIRFGG